MTEHWLADWFNGSTLDLRPTSEFQQQHIRGTTSLPWERLAVSMHELPDKHRPLQLLGHQSQLRQASQFLADKGYQISRQIISSEDFWQWADVQSITETGCQTVPLWQANPLLVECIEQIESATIGRNALDLACGAGRDSVYLASRGWQVTAIDIKQDALARCQALAESSQCQVQCEQADIEQQPEHLAERQFDLIIVMRFLYRPLLPRLISHLAPGGLLCYSTFMVGSEQFGSPRNPNFLLKAGELADVYRVLSILGDETRHLPDGRPVNLFLAQKPA